MDSGMFENLIIGLLLTGAAIGISLVGICWLLWHFLFSHITIGWI